MKESAMARTSLQTLGKLALLIDGKPINAPSTQKARALLVYLILRVGKDVARDSLLELFWPDSDPERARQSLKTATWSIRRSLRDAGFEPDDFLSARKTSIQWIATAEVDAERFMQLSNTDDDAARAEALQLYHGDFLETNNEEWAVTERERLASQYERLLGQALVTSSDPQLAQRLIARNPYDENAWRALIEAELKAARPFTARILVDRCRDALAEVGAQPSAQFEARFGNLVTAPPPDSGELRLPFVGREQQLESMMRCFADLKAGIGSIVLVEGEAGIGKSTFLLHARRAAASYGLPTVMQHVTPADPRSFGFWGELFEELCGASFADFAKAGGSEVVDRLAVEICEHLERSCVLFVEDAHLLAGDALDVLLSVARLAATTKRSVVMSARPEGATFLRARLGNVSARELYLPALVGADVHAAVQQSIRAVTDEFCEGLFQRSGGHPYFLMQLLQALYNEGYIARVGAHWEANRLPDSQLPLPDTVRRYIELRLRARGDAPAHIACALALDPEANTSDLIAVTGVDETAALDAIDDLLALGLIRQTASGPEFKFTHQLVGETAAVLFSSARTAVIHLAFARRLENNTERGAAFRRARHLHAAHRQLDAGASYLTAATEALEWFALRDALERSTTGIEVLEKFHDDIDADRLRVLLRIVQARTHVSAGDDRDALAPLNDAISTARGVDMAALLMEALQLKASALLNSHAIEASLAAGQEAAAIAERVGADDSLSRSLAVVCSAHCHRADRHQALAAGARALEAAQRCGRSDVIAAAADMLLRAQITWWDFNQAQHTAELGLDAAQRAGWISEGAFYLIRGALWFYMDDLDRAELELGNAIGIAEDVRGERRWLMSLAGIDRLKLRFFSKYMQGVVKLARGRYTDAAVIAAELARSNLFQTSYMVRNNILNLWIDALSSRRDEGDAKVAEQLSNQLEDDKFEQGSILDLSTCVALGHAQVGVWLRAHDATQLLNAADEAVNRFATLRPLVCDNAFKRLADAAAEIGAVEIEQRARQRCVFYRQRRLQAASSQPVQLLT